MKLNLNERIEGGRLFFEEMVSTRPQVEHAPEVRGKMTEAFIASGQKMKLRPRIAAIHEGITRNYTEYTSERLMGNMQAKPGPSGLYSFTQPYPKPMLKNHDHTSEPTGRITAAQYVRDGLTGKSFVMIMPEITDPDTIEKVLDGRYMTVSIGCSTDHAYCSICGTDILDSAEDFCGHYRGTTYEGKQCVWKLGELWFDECSWVNVPADSSAQVINTGEAEVYAEFGHECFDVTHGGGISESIAHALGFTEALVEGEEKTVDIEDPKPTEDLVEESAPELVVVPESNLPAANEPKELVPETEATVETPVSENTDQILTLEAQIVEQSITIETLKALIEDFTARISAIEIESQARNASALEAMEILRAEEIERTKIAVQEAQHEITEQLGVETKIVPEPLEEKLDGIEDQLKKPMVDPNEYRIKNEGYGASGEEYTIAPEPKASLEKTSMEHILEIFSGKNRK